MIEMVSVKWCLRCKRRALHVFLPSRAGGRWLCDRCKGRELPVPAREAPVLAEAA